MRSSPGKDVHISFGQSPIVSPFMEAAAKGRPLDPAWVSSPLAKPTLKGALIASAQLSASGEAVSATINFDTVEHDFVRH